MNLLKINDLTTLAIQNLAKEELKTIEELTGLLLRARSPKTIAKHIAGINTSVENVKYHLSILSLRTKAENICS